MTAVLSVAVFMEFSSGTCMEEKNSGLQPFGENNVKSNEQITMTRSTIARGDEQPTRQFGDRRLRRAAYNTHARDVLSPAYARTRIRFYHHTIAT